MHYLDYSERVQHGSQEFPAAYYYVDARHPRYHMPMHWHRETELLRVLRGRLNIWVDGEALRLEEGALLIISEGSLHGGTPEDCVYECLVMDDKALLQGAEAIRRRARTLLERSMALICPPPALKAAADALFSSARAAEGGGEMRLMAALYAFLDGLSTASDAAAPIGDGTGKGDAMKPVLEYIEAHYAEKITLEALSRVAGMSPKYFCRYFRAAAHRTPIDYLNYYRTECARGYLAGTDMTVAEIAYRCGFSDSSFFIRSFKKYQSVTPRAYRMAELNAAGTQK